MIEPTDPIAAVTHSDPYPYYARLVRDRPVSRDAATGLWVFASAAAVTTSLTNEDYHVRPTREPVPAPLVPSPVGTLFGRLIRMRDDPGRAPLRAALRATLGELGAAELTTAARRSLALLHAGSDKMSLPALADACTSRLPCLTVATLLGVPEAQVARTADQASTFVRAASPTSTEAERAKGATAVEELLAALRALPDRAPAGAPEPLLARLRRANRRAGSDHEDGHGEALLANVIGLLFQAHHATAGLIGNTLVTLARHPELADAMRADSALLPDLLREVARHDAPVQNTRRFVAEDTTLLGQELRAGDAVLLLLAAANRDPAANPEADRFLPTRRDPRCFTFDFGRHACIGETIAVAIAAAGVAHLLEQHGDLTPLAPAGVPAGYRASVNARIPRFTVVDQPHITLECIVA